MRSIYEEKKKDNKWLRLDISMYVFPQIWGSTCTGFDVDKYGNPVMSGSAMTEAYTIVVYERVTGRYFVFFDGKICYVVGKAKMCY